MIDLFSKTAQVSPVLNFKNVALVIVLSVMTTIALFHATNGKIVLPGDLYKIKGGKRIYIPFGSASYLAGVILLILATDIIFYVIAFAALYIFYKAVIKKDL